MTTVPVTRLRKGDTIHFGDSRRTYELERDPQIHSFEHGLRILSFTNGGGPGTVAVPADANVTAVRMIRTVEVPCLVHQNTVPLLIDMATDPVPRAILCGECDERVTARVAAYMAEDSKER